MRTTLSLIFYWSNLECSPNSFVLDFVHFRYSMGALKHFHLHHIHSWFCIVAQCFNLYSEAGLTALLYTLPFTLRGILLLQNTPDRTLHFIQPEVILFSTSCLSSFCLGCRNMRKMCDQCRKVFFGLWARI